MPGVNYHAYSCPLTMKSACFKDYLSKAATLVGLEPTTFELHLKSLVGLEPTPLNYVSSV